MKTNMKNDFQNRFVFINWQKFHEISWELAGKIVGGDFYIAPNKRDRHRSLSLQPQYIVAISRGGLALARILSDFLKLPIYNISIESYAEIGKSKTATSRQEFVLHIHGHWKYHRTIRRAES